MPLAPLARRLAVRELALLLLGGYAFALEPLVQRATRGSHLEGVLRLEPMLGAYVAVLADSAERAAFSRRCTWR